MIPIEPETTSHAVLLTGRQWIGLGLPVLAAALLVPPLWERIETFEPGPDYRLPYALSNDYWLYGRWARKAEGIPIVGDSVVWGQYVTPAKTLSHFLNERAGGPRFANLGLDGAHPAALAGLLEHYGGGLSGRTVVLHANPLWLTSPRADLQEAGETRLNHPVLLPQFRPRIPACREAFSVRLGRVIERSLPIFGWMRHLQAAYFGGQDLPSWTLDHPGENPLGAITLRLPPPDDRLRHEPIPWAARGIARQDYPWVDPDRSLQWASFRRVVDLLERRGSRLFVLVGPFNEHLLTEASLARYRTVRQGIEAWLRQRKIPFEAPPALPSGLYADASHPLAAGYEALASRLAGHDFFRQEISPPGRANRP